MLYDFRLPLLSIILFSVSALCLIYILFVYLRRLAMVRRKRRACDQPSSAIALVYPRVSVVVCARDEADSLERLLTGILDQKYDGYFEVIVVNDGASTDTELTVTRLQTDFPNLHLTFTPDGVHGLSRRKLAITLGVKAAKGDVVIVTDASTRVGSDRWLQLMASPFLDERVGVVLGYNAPIFSASKWLWRRTQVFDAFEDIVTWLSAAISGKAYRGDGTNLAYRRELFFENKGFSRSLNLHEGDDDIFVYEIVRPGNTEVQIASDAIGTEGHGHNLHKRLQRRRVSHCFTGRKLPKTSRRLMTIGEWLMWVCAATAVGGAFFSGVDNLAGWGIAALIFLLMIVPVTICWRKTLQCLGGPDLLLRLLYLVPFRPVRNVIANLRSRFSRAKVYSWQKS